MTAPDSYAALRHSFVRSFAIGRFAAIAGWQMINVAVGWLLYERTAGAWSLGLVGVAELTPVLFLMVIAGNAADRYPRRNIGIFAHAVLTLAATGLALLSYFNGPTWAIYALLFMVGTARAFASPSVNTILPQLLPPAEFANANAWLSSTFQLAAITGPAIGGMLIAATGAATVSFALAAVGQFVFILMLRTMPVRMPPAHHSAQRDGGPSGSRRSASEVFAGFRFVRANPLFLSAITLDLFAVLFGGAVALLPIFAKDILQVGPAGLGYLRAAPGVGALSMALITTRLTPWQRPGTILLWAVAGFGLATIGFGLSRSFALSLFCLFLTGVFDNISVVIRLTLEQTITPDHLRGRVSAINYVFIGFSNEFGAFESGATAALFGPTLSVVGGGFATLLVVAMVRGVWPQLARIGPLHTLTPAQSVEVTQREAAATESV
ncbi:MAG: MFS transporter [Cyanobacteria bacterium]|nr:MFS transporter [Cyanobacteriota bacterium]